MFNSFRSMGTTAGIVVVAIACGTTVAAADTEVKVKNSLGVSVEVNFTGDKGFKPIKEYQFGSEGDARTISKAVTDGTTIHWEAKPKHDQDKAVFTMCKGDKKVTGSSFTIELVKGTCSQGSANAAPNAGTGANQPPKAGSNTQADKKPAGSGAGSAAGSGAGSAAGSGAGSGAGRGAGSGSDSATSKKIGVKFDNQMDTTAVTLRIYDEVAGGGATDIDSLGAATLNGKPWDVRHVTSAIYFETDKSGNYLLMISMQCGKDGQGGVKYKGSASTIQIVKSGNGGCELKGVTKVP